MKFISLLRRVKPLDCTLLKKYRKRFTVRQIRVGSFGGGTSIPTGRVEILDHEEKEVRQFNSLQDFIFYYGYHYRGILMMAQNEKKRKKGGRMREYYEALKQKL